MTAWMAEPACYRRRGAEVLWKNFTASVVCRLTCSKSSIKAKAVARNAGADIVDLGMGNPDLPAPAHVIEKLKETIGKPRTDRYSASRGIAGLRRAQAAYYERRFGVKLNPETQIVATLGSKEGFANVAQAITAPGDVILVPNPSYPIHAFGFLMAGGVIRSVPSEPTPEFFVTMERAIEHSTPKPIAAVVCYPANPTAYVAELDFYKDLVVFAKKHEIMILSDLAYAEVYFDNNPPPSVLQVNGAMDIAVEFTSMSKTYSMPGWRMGFAVGNERIIAAFGAGEILSRLRCLYADPGCRDRGVERAGGLHPRDARMLQAPARRAGGFLWPCGLGDPRAEGIDVRLGADSRAVQAARQHRILQAAGGKGRGRGRARHRLWRIWRRLRSHRTGGKRAAHPSGRPQYPAFS